MAGSTDDVLEALRAWGAMVYGPSDSEPSIFVQLNDDCQVAEVLNLLRDTPLFGGGLAFRSATLDEELMNLLAAADHVSSLSFTHCRCEVEPSRWAELSHLQAIGFFQTQVANDVSHLAACTGLRSFKLHSTKTTAAGLQVLGQLPKLTQVELHGLAVGDAAIEGIRRATALEIFSGQDLRLHGESLKVLGASVNLHRLLLRHNPLTGPLEPLLALKQLQVLDLSATQVNDQEVACLVALPQLKFLILSKRMISEETIQQLRDAMPDTHIDV